MKLHTRIRPWQWERSATKEFNVLSANRRLAALGILCLLVLGRVHAADLESAGSIPAPPGAEDVAREVEGAGGLTATIPNGDKASVLKFYGDYFDEQGWILFKSFGLLFNETRFYRKGEKTLSLHVTKMFGELHVQINDLTDGDEAISPETLAAATAKVPLPPGATVSRLEPSPPAGSFSLRADLSKSKTDDVLGFYRDHFAKVGWESHAYEGAGVKWLDFEKGRESVSVSVKEIEGGLELRITYREYEYSREEFDRRVHESATSEASTLIQRVVDAYGALKSYADTGTHESFHDREVLSTAKFSTHYVAPDKLRFEYAHSMKGWFHTNHVLSKLGDSVRVESSVGGTPDIDNDISLAIASLYGVTSATSGNIPELLLRLDDGMLFNLVDLSILSETKVEDGTLCLRLHGKDFHGEENTIWIGKDDLLIRKIESVENKDNRQTTTYSPKVNIEIADEDLAFRKPVAKN